jgi:hypothetical protein
MRMVGGGYGVGAVVGGSQGPTEYVRTDAIRIEWQLYELDTGDLLRCPPKDDSYRTVDTPPWHSRLLRNHIARTQPQPCPCHERKYVFRGLGAAKGIRGRSGTTIASVAARAGVSVGTVPSVLNRPERVPEATRVKVELAVGELGYVRGRPTGELASHWRRTGFATRLFRPATTGWYPAKAPYPARPVPVLAEPWPGVPCRAETRSSAPTHAGRRSS